MDWSWGNVVVGYPRLYFFPTVWLLFVILGSPLPADATWSLFWWSFCSRSKYLIQKSHHLPYHRNIWDHWIRRFWVRRFFRWFSPATVLHQFQLDFQIFLRLFSHTFLVSKSAFVAQTSKTRDRNGHLQLVSRALQGLKLPCWVRRRT